VAGAVAVLCSLPAIAGALPVPGSRLTASQLSALILASARVPYQGYAESTADLALPSLPVLGGLTSVLSGTTDQYAWYRSPAHWRADTLTTAGETDDYQAGTDSFRWDYARDLLAQQPATAPVRLPRAADLLPPELARTLLRYSSGADRLSRIGARRVAGVDAAGLQVVPAAPQSTIGRLRIWADPATGLPVEVAIYARGDARPAVVSRFLEVRRTLPALAAVIPQITVGAGRRVAELPDITSALNRLGTPLPRALTGAPRIAIPGVSTGLAAYGAGFARFAVIRLPAEAGERALAAARAGGAGSGIIALPHGSGVLIRAPLLTVLLARDGCRGPVNLLAGPVTGPALIRAGSQLLADRVRR
jgi:hypothetical protein